MDKSLKQKDDLIRTLSEKSDELQARKAATEARISEIQAEIPSVQAAIKSAYANGDDLVELDKRRLQLRNDLELARLGLEGINAELDRIENELSQAITDRNERFSTLAGSWLTKEGTSFNALVDKLRDSTRRLFACRRLLDELGEKAAFVESLGPGANHLQSLVLLRLMNNSFAASDLQGDRQRQQLRPTNELCEQVFSEVTR